MRKVSPYLISSFLCTLSQRYLLRLAALFFPNNMEGSKRTTTRFGHLCSSTKKKSKKTKKIYSLMIESLLSSNTSNRFKFIVTPNRCKNLWPPSQKWNYDSYLQENQGLQTASSCDLYQVSLKSEQFTGAKGATSGVNNYHLHLIKPQIVYFLRSYENREVLQNLKIDSDENLPLPTSEEIHPITKYFGTFSSVILVSFHLN